ncbi:MAG: acyl-CoA dehydratase activase [Planctomycetota bacterium]|jgi:predicted CoA-substrate-specific enzyme activase
MIVAGVDSGSRAIKVVVLEAETRTIVTSGTTDQGVAQADLAQELFHRLLRAEGLGPKDVAYTVATGHGRKLISFCDKCITEITCHAAGVHHQLPQTRALIDIGGQDSKVVRLREGGAVRDFNMNDRCAAGTGRFLEVVAQRLGLDLGALGGCAQRSEQAATISSMCVVFAETEIVGLLATGASPADIAAGVQLAIATRIASLAGRSIEEPLAFTGGVALVGGMAQALERALGHPVTIPETPQLTGALGAALLAAPESRRTSGR